MLCLFGSETKILYQISFLTDVVRYELHPNSMFKADFTATMALDVTMSFSMLFQKASGLLTCSIVLPSWLWINNGLREMLHTWNSM